MSSISKKETTHATETEWQKTSASEWTITKHSSQIAPLQRSVLLVPSAFGLSTQQRKQEPIADSTAKAAVEVKSRMRIAERAELSNVKVPLFHLSSLFR
jgi:hypothetical protein